MFGIQNVSLIPFVLPGSTYHQQIVRPPSPTLAVDKTARKRFNYVARYVTPLASFPNFLFHFGRHSCSSLIPLLSECYRFDGSLGGLPIMSPPTWPWPFLTAGSLFELVARCVTPLDLLLVPFLISSRSSVCSILLLLPSGTDAYPCWASSPGLGSVYVGNMSGDFCLNLIKIGRF